MKNKYLKILTMLLSISILISSASGPALASESGTDGKSVIEQTDISSEDPVSFEEDDTLPSVEDKDGSDILPEETIITEDDPDEEMSLEEAEALEGSGEDQAEDKEDPSSISKTTDHTDQDNKELSSEETLVTVTENPLNAPEEEPEEVPEEEPDKVWEFVERCYLLVLGRTPSKSEVQNKVDLLKNGSQAGATTLWGFFFSQEFKNKNYSDEDYIRLLYKVAFNRNVDPTGLANRTKEFEYGFSREYSLSRIIMSNEYKKLCASFGIKPGSIGLTEVLDKNPHEAMYVYNLYKDILGRKPDKNGYISNVNLAVSEGAKPVIVKFFGSPEYARKGRSDEDYIKDVFKIVLKRSPEAAALNSRLESLSYGLSRMYILKGVLDAREFTNKATAAGVNVGTFPESKLAERDKYPKITEYVFKVFSNTLNRKPTPSYLDDNSERLANDRLSVLTFLQSVVNSGESRKKYPENDSFVKTAYKGVLFRNADATGLKNRLSDMEEGVTRPEIINILASSKEFTNLAKKYGLNLNNMGWMMLPGGIKYYKGGKAVTGWQHINGERYCFDTKTAFACAGWNYIDGYKYYFDENGVNIQDVDDIIGRQSSYMVTVVTSECITTVWAKDGNNGYIIPVKSFVCSPGANDCTVKGTFTLRTLGTWGTLMGPVYGQYITQIWKDYLFHTTWYYENRNHYSLSVYNHNLLGTQQSHGCVRLMAKDCKWIYEHCNGSQCTVSTYGPTPFDKPEVQYAVPVRGDYGYDPTDPYVN